MRDYEVESGIQCHIFIEAESYSELLTAISLWWIANEEETKCLASIIFRIDDEDGTYEAEVSWSFLTPEKGKELDALLNTPRDLPTVEIPSSN